MLHKKLLDFFASRPKGQHWLAIGLLTLCVFIAFPQWYSAGAPMFDDLTRLNAPQRILLGWMYQHGYMPFWNPYSFGGQPLLAAGQSGPLYLPNVFYVLLPIVVALKTSYLFHELLAAYGMYAVGWQLSRSRMAAMVTSLSFITCGFMLGHQIHTQMYDAMSWLPVIFWLFLKLLSEFTVWRMAGLSVCLALEVYAGHPQVTFYILLLLGLYSVLQVIQHFRNPVIWRNFIAGWCSLLVGLFLSALQWLPTLNFIGYSNRATATPQFLLQWSLPPQGALQFLSPFIFGGGYADVPISPSSVLSFYQSSLFWEFTCYMGIVALALALGGIPSLWRRFETARNLLILGLVFAVLALGSNGFLSWVLVHVPGFNLFRVPARYIGLTDFCFACLAGMSVAQLMTSDTKARIRQLRWIGAAACLFLVILIMARFEGPLIHGAPLTFWLPAGICVLIMLVCWVVNRTTKWFTVGYLSILAIADSVTQSGAFSKFILGTTPPAYTHFSGATAYIKSHLDVSDPFQRIAAMNGTSLTHDQAAAFQIPALNGYDSLEPDWYARHVDLTWDASTVFLQPRRMIDALDVKYIVTSYADRHVLPRESIGIQNWTHWIPNLPSTCNGILIQLDNSGVPTDTEAPLCSVTLVSGSHKLMSQVSVYDTQLAITLPNDWPHQQATEVRVNNESWFSSYKVKAVTLLANGQPIPGKAFPIDQWFGPNGWKQVYQDGDEVVWENPDTLDSAWLAGSAIAPLVMEDGGTVQKIAYTPNRQKWSIKGANAGFLVLSQMYDPNWTATVDGKTVKVQQMDGELGGVLTGVPVPAGSHEVTLEYVPGGFRLGILLAIAGLFGLMGVITADYLLRRSSRRHNDSDKKQGRV